MNIFIKTYLMKKLYKSVKAIAILVLLSLSFLVGPVNVFGQSATWNLTSTNTPVVCGSVTAVAPVAGAGVANVTSVNATSGFSGTDFPTGLGAGNYNNGATDYFQYAVTNTGASTITFTSLNIGTYYTGAFPLFIYMAIRYSTDNFASSILYTSDVLVDPGVVNFTGTTSIAVTAGATLRYRVYGYFSDGSAYRFGNTFFQVSAAPLPPAAFSAVPISGTQINLNGTANGAGNNVMLVYNTVNTFGTPVQGTNYIAGNAIPGGGTVLYVGAAGNPFFNHMGLVQGATYYYQLYSVSAGCNLYSTPLTANATTLCPNFPLNVSEGFNTAGPNTFPVCWTQQFVSGTSPLSFETTTNNPVTNPQEGTRFVSWNSFLYSSGNQTRLVSPRITTTGTASVNTMFYWFHDNSAYTSATYATEGVQLQYSLDGTTWVNVGAQTTRVLVGKNGWTVYDVTLPAPAGNAAQVYVGFLFTSRFGDNCSLDNVLVYPTPTCKIPNSPLTASAITTTTATISWAAASPVPAQGYDYYVSTSPVAPTGATVPTGNSAGTSANLVGLIQNTTYYFWVRSKCSAVDQSQWVGAGTFETVSIYCTSTSTSPSVYYINQVKFVGTLLDITNNSTWSASGYQNFTALSPKSIQAQGEGINVYVQSNFSTMIKAWVDWNGNTVFDAAEEVYNTNGILTSTTTFGFVVPLATVPGDYIIRIRTTGTGASSYGACGVLSDGETEDYLFTVVASCPSLITAVGDGETCGSGTVVLSADGSPGTTQFFWYTAATGGAPVANTPTGAWTTPPLGATTTYYVTAYNDACESLVRTAVVAKISPIPVLSFTPVTPVVCGEGAVLNLNASGNTEEAFLINEKFESGLGVFTVNNININPVTETANAQWQSKTSTYIPANTTVWRPAISSGFSTNKFAFATSDLLGIGFGTLVNSAIVSPTVNSTGYLNLTLEFDLFYSHYLPDGNNSIIDSVIVEISTDAGTNWAIVSSYVIDQGIGTKFANKSINLNAYINNANLKIRFRYYGNWTDGASIDNVVLSGFKPLATSFSWSPTGGGNLFTDAAGMVPYVSGSVPTIYVKPTPAEIAAGLPLTFTATATLSNGCSASTPVTVNIGPSQWTGQISTDWHNINNWCSKVVPTATTVVEIPSVGIPRFPVISAPAVAKSLTILSGASLTINNTGSLSLPGNFDNQLGATLVNNGRIELNGSSATAQTFPGAGTITAMSILHINNSNAGVAINKSFTIETELRPTLGNLALGNFDITIRSLGVNTASVSTVGGSAGFSYGTGRFVIERYINTGGAAGQHGKSWQFITAPAQGQTIHQGWMENAAANANPNSGFGTQIPGVGGTASGFDAVSFLPAIKTYTPAGNTWNATSITNPTLDSLYIGTGYMLFVRGDRSVINFSGANSSPLPTRLRVRGRIKVGTFTSPTVVSGQFAAIGNPYPSTVDFSAFTKTGGIANNFIVFDPTLTGTQGLGAYQTISAATGYKATPGNFMTTSTIYNTTSDYRNIQSGSAFFISASGSNGTIGIKEADKRTPSTLVNRGGEANRELISMLSTNLLRVDGTTMVLVDGNRVVFDKIYQNKIDAFDAVKKMNEGENFGLNRHGATLAVEARKKLKVSDTIFYKMAGLLEGSYKLMFIPQRMAGSDLQAELIDKYLHTRTAVSLNDTGYVDISITTDLASGNPGRFMLVFRHRDLDLPVTGIPPFSKTEKTITPGSQGDISVFPNPLAGKKVQLQFNNKPAGKYTIQVSNKAGQLVYSGSAEVTGIKFVKIISLNPSISAGVYHLKTTGPDGVINTRQVIVP